MVEFLLVLKFFIFAPDCRHEPAGVWGRRGGSPPPLSEGVMEDGGMSIPSS